MSPHQKMAGMEIVGIGNVFRRLIADAQPEEDRLTSMQVMILGFLDQNSDHPVYQKDLEHVFRIRRSTATGLLQNLEHSGFLYRRSVPTDARLKQIMITEKGLGYCTRSKQRIDELNAIMTEGVTEEELGIFFQILSKMRRNMEQEAGIPPLMAECELKGECADNDKASCTMYTGI